MVQTLMMRHVLLNLENQIAEVNGGGQNSKARPFLHRTILTIKFTGQIYGYFLWYRNLPVVFMIRKNCATQKVSMVKVYIHEKCR